MNGGLTLSRPFQVQRTQRGRKKIHQSGAGQQLTAGCMPRVARLMALAIRFDQLIRDGVATDQAELARLGHVSRARLTQIMNLLTLAPDIQEVILFLPQTQCGRDLNSERRVRRIAALIDWHRQRLAWQQSFYHSD